MVCCVPNVMYRTCDVSDKRLRSYETAINCRKYSKYVSSLLFTYYFLAFPKHAGLALVGDILSSSLYNQRQCVNECFLNSTSAHNIQGRQ